MQSVRLGKTGLEVSRVGIGGIPIQRPPLDEAIKTIQRAVDLGANLVDTSRSMNAPLQNTAYNRGMQMQQREGGKVNTERFHFRVGDFRCITIKDDEQAFPLGELTADVPEGAWPRTPSSSAPFPLSQAWDMSYSRERTGAGGQSAYEMSGSCFCGEVTKRWRRRTG